MLQEDHRIGVVRAFGVALDAEALQQRVDLVPLLSGEDRPLSEGARRDLLRQRFSYYTDDLVVLTWDRAFIHEPRGDSDVMDVLDVANARLLEMRYYDQLLQTELPRRSDLADATQHAVAGLGAPRCRARRRAFAAVGMLMDYLKTDSPLWKKETGAEGVRWIEPRTEDKARRAEAERQMT